MFTASKELTWDMAHRLINYEGKCAELHGHTYSAIVTFSTTRLDEHGFVIDFGDIKSIVKKWVDKFWDHGTMLHENDPMLPGVRAYNKKVYTMPCNPSAENIAKELLGICKSAVPQNKNYRVVSVEIKETPTSTAKYSE